MNLHHLQTAADAHGLFVMGACHPAAYGGATLVLLGAGPHMWARFSAAPERNDGVADPLDRWSKRIIAGLAPGQTCLFPSDGPPYTPFIAFALETGQFYQSPTGMMVHERAGLMISIRGAIVLDGLMPLRPPAENPCTTCKDRPCISACPIGALSGDAPYDVPACKAFISSDPAQACMTDGCAARNACPVSQRFARDENQSAFHMRAFMGMSG